MRIFADTFYWVALINRKDGANRAVLEFSRTLVSSTLITADEVLIELLAFCASDQQLRMAAALTMQDILDGGNVRAIPQSRAGLLGGLALYKARPDKGYSLTDCISMQRCAAKVSRMFSPTTGISSRKASGPYFVQRSSAKEARANERHPLTILETHLAG